MCNTFVVHILHKLMIGMRDSLKKGLKGVAEVTRISASQWGSEYYRIHYLKGPRKGQFYQVRIANHNTTGSYQGRQQGVSGDFRTVEEAVESLLRWNTSEDIASQAQELKKAQEKNDRSEDLNRKAAEIRKLVFRGLVDRGYSKRQAKKIVADATVTKKASVAAKEGISFDVASEKILEEIFNACK